MNAQIIAMIAIILHIITISLYGIFLALLGYFLDFCFWRHNVFSFWLPALARFVSKLFYKKEYRYAKTLPKEKAEDYLIETVQTHGLFKMLGGCAACFNVWLGFITYPLIHAIGHSYWYLPIYILSASFVLRKIMKID